MLHQIGVGALGPVFRTYEPTRDRLVAVKVFRLDVTPEQAHALAQELGRAAEAGLFHPSIVEPLAAGMEGTLAYRAEEYVAAETLDIALRHYAPATIDKVLPFITQLAGAIDFGRAADVRHGALHPRDIFVTPDEARATGFGVVEALERVGLRAPVRRPYSAPERVDGSSWETTADVFSLAAITYELLTGRRPSGTGAAIGALTGPSAEAAGARLHAVLAQAMHDDPSQRPSSALAFASELEAAARGGLQAPAAAATAAATVPAIGAVAVAPETEPTPDAAVPRDPPSEAPDVEPAVDLPSADEVEDIRAEQEEDGRFYELTRETDAQSAAAEQRQPGAHTFESDRSGDDRWIDDVAEPEAEFDAHYAAEDLTLAAAAQAGLADEYRRPASAEEPFEAVEPPLREHGTRFAAPLAREQDLFAEDDPYDIGRGGEPAEADPGKGEGWTFGPAAGPPDRTASTRSRSMLPLATMLVLGLLIGFGGAYALLQRTLDGAPRLQQGEPVPSAQEQATEAPPEQPARVVEEPPIEAPAIPDEVAGDAGAPSPPARAAATRGRLEVRSTPSAASVTLNGKWTGRTPLTLEDLALGRYEVRVVQPGYDVAREDVTLSANDPAQALSFTLRRQPAPAAQKPPASAPRAAAPAQRAPAGQTAPARPERFTGALYVDSRPRGATVLLNGKRIGTTPMRLPEVPIGSQIVRLELEGHRPWTTSVRIAAGQEARATGSLEPIQ